MPKLNEIPDKPIYPIKTVSARTGILPVTLRAWERRYHLLTPQRGDNRYRLYSEQDIAILTWVKDKVEDDLQISTAARLVDHMRKTGDWPEAKVAIQTTHPKHSDEPPSKYVPLLYQTLHEKKESTALEVLEDVYSKFELLTIFSEILTPVLVKIGEAWYDGRIGVSTEHFASSLIRGWMLKIFYALPSRQTSKRILVGAGPDEMHEIGELMFACLLREKEYFADYIGPDNPVEDLVSYADEEKAVMVILTASIDTNAFQLKKIQEKLDRLPKPPIFAYAGQAFNLFPALITAVPGVYLGKSLEDGLKKVEELLCTPNR
jgi:DNA-binding transcriptional MerR regulator